MAKSHGMNALGAAKPVPVTPEIIDLGRFAVHENNKKENTLLEFKKVMSAMEQVMGGSNYYLTLKAANEGKNEFYEAQVYVSLENVKEVLKFMIVTVGPGSIYPIHVTPRINHLGRFAVHEHNNKENKLLEFKEVWSAKEAVAAGFKYFLTLKAADEGMNNVYEAIQRDQFWSSSSSALLPDQFPSLINLYEYE
ncbi:UNVERIFIED_CONTAM: Multicystatin [Sesamum latifolium]|uniref:Cysteine proteinase inhibitor n=1 Tax=Sesamum latifolium TaxID=2727402 RepID=A0AAW2Y513_9LAMI